ncbi:MAG: hypothetical protein SF187_30275 [Deltaproteobacteria bacterium]|nr:hypothetical protein [Deltaproteobacteria bacterium]
MALRGLHLGTANTAASTMVVVVVSQNESTEGASRPGGDETCAAFAPSTYAPNSGSTLPAFSNTPLSVMLESVAFGRVTLLQLL